MFQTAKILFLSVFLVARLSSDGYEVSSVSMCSAGWGTALDGFSQHFDGETCPGWHDYGSGEQAALHPCLSRCGNTVAANVGQTEPSFLLDARGQFLKGFFAPAAIESFWHATRSILAYARWNN
jgi:hypothetical protein